MVDIPKPKRNLLLVQNDDSDGVLFRLMSSRYTSIRVTPADDLLEAIHSSEAGVVLAEDGGNPDSALQQVKTVFSEVDHAEIIVLASGSVSDQAIEFFRAGAFDLIQKPFDIDYVEEAVARAFDKFESSTVRSQYQTGLEHLLVDRSEALDKALEEVENSYRVTLKALVQALETRDFETHGHSERVVTFSLRLGHELGLDDKGMHDLELGALLHDIGKIGVPDSILRKPSKLNEREWEKMKLHPVHGHRILRNIPFLSGAAKVVSQHHEQWDGSGYPNGLKGEAIDIGARIFAVVDAFDAMISDRVYRPGRPYADAVEELEKCSGSQFDPAIVDAFKAVPVEDWDYLRERSIKATQEVFSFRAIVEELVRSREHETELVH